MANKHDDIHSNPMRGLMDELQKSTEESKGKTKAKTKTKAEPAPAKADKPKRTFRINLALRSDIGEELKRRAGAENRSVNNYIEQLLLDHFEK